MTYLDIIKSVKKPLLILPILGIAMVGVYFLSTQSAPTLHTPSQADTGHIKINDKSILTVFIPTTITSSNAGLAVFDKFYDDYAMLFRTPPDIEPALWMKDMKFDIDMVWLDSDDRIAFINHQVSHLDQETVYQAPEQSSAKCVIELNAGASHRLKLKLGDKLKFTDRSESLCQNGLWPEN